MAHEDENNTGVAGDDLTTLDLHTIERRRLDTIARLLQHVVLTNLLSRQAELHADFNDAFDRKDLSASLDLALAHQQIENMLTDPTLFSCQIAGDA
jgi:hypothetical protein